MVSEEYLKAFIIGSSLPVFILFFIAVAKMERKKEAKYSYEYYTLIAPLYLGLLNMLGLSISKQYNLSRLYRFLITAIIGASIVAIFITVMDVYNFKSKNRWYEQYFWLFVTYIFVFVVIVNGIDFMLVLDK